MKIFNLFLFYLLPYIIVGQPVTKKYILTFHTCERDCGNPMNHTVQLTESNDGINWTQVPNFQPFQGSVPDVITRNDKLYLYTPGRVKRYDKQSNTWIQNTSVSIKDSTGQRIKFVDPSPYLDENGKIVLFFLNSTGSTSDPAICPTYPCNKIFDSAVEKDGSDGTEFVVTSGHRLTYQLTSGSASDPDIFTDGKRFIMYVSAGTNTLAFISNTLHGAYTSISGLSNQQLTNQGGIPCGYYDEIERKYWTFVHTNSGNTTIIRGIRHDSINRTMTTGFQTLISGATFSNNPNLSCASPGFCVNTMTTTGLNDESNSQNFSLYPNPSAQTFAILGDSPIHHLWITDYQGKTIQTYSWDCISQNIKPINWTNGIYFVHIQSNSQILTRKLVYMGIE